MKGLVRLIRLRPSRRFLCSLLFIFLIFGVGWLVARATVMKVSRAQWENRLSRVLGAPMTVANVQLRWQHEAPELVLNQVTLFQYQKPLLKARQVRLVLNVAKSIWHRRWTLSSVALDRVSLEQMKATSVPKHLGSIRNWLFSTMRRYAADFEGTRLTVSHFICPIPRSFGLQARGVLITELQGEFDHGTYQLFSNKINLLGTKTSLGLHLDLVPSEARGAHAQVTLALTHFDLNDWKRNSLLHHWLLKWGVHRACFDAQLVGHFDGRRITSVNGRVYARNLGVAMRPLSSWLSTTVPLRKLELMGVNVHFVWTNQLSRKGLIVLPVLRFEAQHHQFHFNHLSLHYFIHRNCWILDKVSAQHFPISALSWWLHTLHVKPPGERWFQRLHPEGNVDYVYFNRGPGGLLRALQLKLTALSWQPWKGIPGLSSVQGQVTLLKKHVQFRMQSQKAPVQSTVFPQIHQLKTVSLVGDAQYFGQNANVHLQNVHISDSNGDVRLSGFVFLRHHRSPRVSLMGSFSLHDVKRIKRFFPVKGLSPDLKGWLNQAFLGGALQQGRIQLNGALNQFPFKHHGGRFVVSAKLSNFDLHFAPHWLPLTHMNGRVSFINDGLVIHAVQSRLLGSAFSSVRARIPHLSIPHLSVHSIGGGDLGLALRVLKQSPLAIGKRLSKLQAKGRYHLNLRLKLDLHQHHSQVQGRLALVHDRLSLASAKLHLSHVSGFLDFTKRSIRSRDLNAVWRSVPLQIHVGTQIRTGHRAVNITTQGLFSDSSIGTWSGWARLSSWLKGSLMAHVQVLLPYAINRPVAVRVTSSLTGTTFLLPAPLNKEASHALPMTLTWIGDEQTHHLEFQLGPRVAVKLMWHHRLQTMTGFIRLGHGVDMDFPRDQLLITGQLNQINVDRWWPVYQAYSSQLGLKKGVNAMPRVHANILINKVQALHHVLHRTLLEAKINRSSATVVVHSTELGAQVRMPLLTPSRSLKVTVFHAHLHSSSSGPFHFNWFDWPRLTIDLHHVDWNKTHVTKLAFETKVIGNQLVFPRFEIKTPFLFAQGSGRTVRFSALKQATEILGQARVLNIAGLLQKQSVEGLQGRAQLGFDLHWPGALLKPEFKHMSGSMQLAITKGVIPVSRHLYHSLVLLRLANFLSVPSLIQNVSTGLGSFLSHGLAFSSVKTTINWTHGLLTFRPFELSSPNINLNLSGTVDLKTKQVNCYLLIKPVFTSSLPVVAGLAGGPVVGAVTWLVKTAMSPIFDHTVVRYYRLTGLWDQPKLVTVGPFKLRSK